ncbi:MAG: hypothetical protein RLZZ258_1430 [Actinomycetota bacterium]
MSLQTPPDSAEPQNAAPKTRKLVGLVLVLFSAIALMATAFVPMPYVIEQPGPTFNTLGGEMGEYVIEIEDTASYPTTGHLELLTVGIVGSRDSAPTLLQVLLAWIDPQKSVLPIDQVFPIGQSSDEAEAESSAMMEISQQDAIAVALTKLGYDVPLHLYISKVSKAMPASGKLVAGDFIIGMDDQVIDTYEQLVAYLDKTDGKNPIAVTVLRDGAKKTFDITPTKNKAGKLVLGVEVSYKYDFPVKVKLQLADVGGPSGGMMFALGVYDKLTPGELTGGAFIAGTGTISPTGKVGAIGGISYKMLGAKAAGAKYFLAPADNCSDVIGNIPAGLEVFKVDNFDQALATVEKIGSKQSLSGLARCTK